MKLPPVIGHRGAAAHAPENTLAGLRAAAAQGVRWVEVDVMLSRDRVPVLVHDDTVDRTTDGTGAIADLTFDALRRLDAGSWFAPTFTGERIPSLVEAVELATRLGLGLNLEIKPSPGRDAETAEVALATLRKVWPQGAPLLISSFELPCLEVAMRVAPDWPRGYLLWDPPDDWATQADRIAAATLAVEQARQTPDTIAAHIATGRPVLAYTVNDPARARDLFAWGIAAVFTDTPRDILPVAPR
ncbi:MAG TPA: glycerophosphoryl diester phosphodiesterase [Azospirillaceae bacterium]|nr:glycerophosphoryl diester phosphodiesterase [Azospirillaceae bacterium]